MKDLWRKTTQVFWRYPILLLPIVAADLIGFCIMRMQLWLTRSLIVWLMGRHHGSVLGTAQPRGDIEVLTLTVLVSPLSWIRYVVCILFYVAAYFVVARHVQSVGLVRDPELIASSLGGPSKGRVLIFAVKMLILYAGTSALIFGALNQSGSNLLTTPVSLWIFAFAVTVVVVYVMTPSGLLLLSSDVFKSDARRKLILARISGMLAALASVVIGAFCSQVAQASAERSHMGTLWWMNAIGSVLVALPYCPLFIALSLIAFEVVPEESAN